MSNKYKDMMSNIQIPHNLKDETLEKIRTAQEAKQTFPKSSSPKKKDGKVFSLSNLIKVASSLAAAALVILVGTRLFLPSSNIVTKLEAGVHTTNVELQNGKLNFAAIENQTLENPPKFGEGFGLVKEEWTAEDFAKFYLSANTLPQLEGYALVGSEIEVFFSIVTSAHMPESATATVLYEKKSGGNLELTISTNSIPASRVLNSSEKSEMENVIVHVGYNPEKEIYIMLFKKDELNYYAEGSGLSQKEFIETLESLVKNK